MVIVLIGILSYGAASLYSSRDGFAGFIAKDQLISSGLLAQQVAMGMSATSDPVSLKVERDDDDFWVFTLTKAGLASIDSFQDSSGSSISVDGTTLSLDSSHTFTWNSNASLSDGANHHVYFVGTNTYRVCFSASGYVYESQVACP